MSIKQWTEYWNGIVPSHPCAIWAEIPGCLLWSLGVFGGIIFTYSHILQTICFTYLSSSSSPPPFPSLLNFMGLSYLSQPLVWPSIRDLRNSHKVQHQSFPRPWTTLRGWVKELAVNHTIITTTNSYPYLYQLYCKSQSGGAALLIYMQCVIDYASHSIFYLLHSPFSLTLGG